MTKHKYILTVEIETTKEIDSITDIVGNRVYTLDAVEDVTTTLHAKCDKIDGHWFAQRYDVEFN